MMEYARFPKRLLAAVCLLLMAGLSLAMAPSAHADALDDARGAGYLGERPDGYLGQVQPDIPASAISLMQDINRKREAVYRQTATKVGRPMREVQTVTGEKLIGVAKQKGWYYLLEGRWTR